ncbi:YhcH/YjgK/YiaL family protein [Spirochaeta isovalerica]|uniref:YhcH/YjgK/YiaL family protein n=1 Tax=Spirochaeta isovalerica TaxID=150 RepID=A0A841R9R1_9SPIO|nr:YhcH/YjgK/YiaL family protein [Spirochaeta isovalerica]MBB6480645.1 YhcH/YjgK/YiaL family protein [Spirochaeta isovalerica]
MIFSSIQAEMRAGLYPVVIEDAIRFFRNTDFSSYETGEYEIRGRDILFQVHDIDTSPAEERKPEIHRKYIDVQFLFKGKESIGVVSDSGENEVTEDLLDQRDILFYKEVKNETFVSMKEGDFCVFFPEDIHRPGCQRDGSSRIRKIVYKINVKLLEDK